ADLPAPARLQLDVVDRRPGRNLPKRQAVTDVRLQVRPASDPLARFQTVRGENVRLLAILVLDQRDAGRAVRVVFDRHDGGDAAVALPLEVDHPVHLLVPAAPEADADDALVVAAALLLGALEQRLLGPVLLRERTV